MSMIREHVPVTEVRVGDFTHVTGFRLVTAVKVYPRRKMVRITWRDTSATYPFGHPKLRIVRAATLQRSENVPIDASVEGHANGKDQAHAYDPAQSQYRAI